MSSLSILDRDLCGILAEMRSEKMTQRQKAFEKLELILNNREEDILRYMAEKKFDNNWQDLLEAAHHGIQKQNRKMFEPNAAASAESKSYIYIKVVQKVVDLAMNRGEPQIQFSELIRRSMDVLSDHAMLRYFGVCYVQILQKHVLNSKWDLTVITYDEWITILTRCFELYDDGRVAKQNVVGCLTLAVRKSLENCSVQAHFVKFLDPLAKMINDCDRGKLQNELIKVAYFCVSGLAVDYRYEVCNFTEQISQRVVKAYEPKMEEETKSIFFRLMHLAVVVHSPEKSFSEWRSNESLFYAVDQTEWNKCLRNFYFVVGNEIKAHVATSYNAVGGKEVPFVEGFMSFAARLCYVMFWHDEVWTNVEPDAGSSVKRTKRANKLQGLMDLIDADSNQPNWRWLIILAEVVSRCPAVLGEEDYQPLLHLLSSIQPKLQLSSQLKAFRLCSLALLNFEKQECFKKSVIINSTYCMELWHKIIECCFRCSTSNSKAAADNHLVLQLLITHRKYPSTTFLNSVLQAFYSYSIVRTNVTVSTISSMLAAVPLEALGNVQEAADKLFNYLFPKSRETQAKGILHNKERLDVKLLAAISVSCSVTKHVQSDNVGMSKASTLAAVPRDKYFEVDKIIRDAEEHILLKSAKKLLVTAKLGLRLMETAPSVTYNVHEKTFEVLCVALNFEKHTLPIENDALCKGLINIICDIELYLEILNDLLAHGALTKDAFEKCLITKKIVFKIQEMELGFDRLKSLTALEMNEMSTRLLTIFRGPYHDFINEMFKTSNFSSLLSWIFKNARNLPDRDSKCIEALQYETLNKEQLNQHNLLLILAHYMKYDGICSNEARGFLDQASFNIDNNLDLFHIFEMSKVLMSQKSTYFLAEWVLTFIKDICRTHHTNNAMTEAIINLYSDLVVFVSPHDALFNDTNTVLLSFIRKANKKNYSVQLQSKIYDQVKYLIKAYPDYYESHEAIYARMIALINSPNFAIKMSAVENLLHLFDDGWAFTEDTVTGDFYRFQRKLYAGVIFEVDDLLNKDEKANLLAAYLQLICGTACNSYYLRKRALLDLVEQVFLNQLSPHKVQTMLKLIQETTSIDTVTAVHDSMEMIFDMWISKSYKLKEFPWCFTDCESMENFVQKYQYDIAFAILCNKPAELPQFCALIKKTLPDTIKVISAKCISFLMPKWADCKNMPRLYAEVAEGMQRAIIAAQIDLEKYMLNDQSNRYIVQQLVECLQDEAAMCELFEREVLVSEVTCVLNAENLLKCLGHLRSLISSTSKHSLLTYLCMKHPAVVEQILLHFKLKIYRSEVTEEKMELLFQYSTIIDQLVDYFCQHRSADLKEHLARDICYFLCNTMICFKSLQVPVLNCLGKFLSKVVPTCAEYLRPHLNFLTSSLLSVYGSVSSGKVVRKVLGLLELVVIEHQALFGDGIKKLNYFPGDDAFKVLRQALDKSKENQYQLTLAEDINRIIQLPQLKYEELATLRGMLAGGKDKLRELCEELQLSDGFSENCSKSVILRLINVLLDEIRNSSSDKHMIEALRCLGEIGPVNLSTMLLKSDAETEIYEMLKSSDEAIEQFVQVVIKELNELIVSKDLTVAEKAAAVCSHILQNGSYRKLANNLRTLFPYMTNAENGKPIFKRSPGKTKLRAVMESSDDALSYTSFVLTLSSVLLEFLQDTVIKSLCDIEIGFSAKIIPLLIQIVLSFCDEDLNEDLHVFVNMFFASFVENSVPTGGISKNLEAIHLMLKIVECIRSNNQNHPQHKIGLNYIAIASASLFCQAYFKAIMYCELWCIDQRNEGASNDSIKDDHRLMTVMKTAHLAIGIEDAAKAFLDPIASRSEYYKLEQKHNQSLLYCDVACAGKSAFERSAYAEALKRSNLYGLASMAVDPMEVDYECAWRLADWNIPLENAVEKLGAKVNWQDVFDKQHYKALKCLELKDETATDSAIFEGRKALAEMLKVASMESTQNIYPFLCKLRQLQQVEDFMNVQFYRIIDGEQELLQKWDQLDKLPYGDFTFMEIILSQRVAILKTARVRAMRKWVPDALHQALFQLIHEARISGHLDVATATIRSMAQQPLSENVKALVMLEDAQLNWAIGDKFLSKRLVNEVVAGGKCKNLMVNAAAYRIYGTFLAETYAEDVHNLHKNFFKQSEALVEESLRQSSQQERSNIVDYQSKCLESDRNFVVLHTVAKYADREFVRLKTHSASYEFKLKKMNLEKLKREQIMLEAEQAKLKETEKDKLSNLRRAKMSAKQNITRDEESLKTMLSNMEDYLKMALLYYSAYTIRTSVESDLAVFRIVALWLGNHSVKIVDCVKQTLKVVPTYKFIPVLPQLVPRLDNRDDGVGKIVWETLERCTVDHPYHTLPHIFAQVYAFADMESKDIPKDDERLLGAQTLYQKLLKNKKIAHIVDQTSEMNLAFIEMANKTLGSARGFSEYKMSTKDALKRCRELSKIHCPTVELKVRENGVYDNIIGVHKWDDQIQGVGGINAPKKLVCHCMDGQTRIQLLKGKDDMRQDAVMEQVFSILNVLLCNDKDANKRKLSVRTYKVVPLSKQSGILEWCSNTMPIGSWLIPAHERYQPKDMTPLDARKTFAELAKSSVRTKQEKFLKICQRLSPVFQHFFLERFLMPGMWFERRLCYIKSVAVSSMISYILGIGDRHVQNILVDEKTAEVIHIDFGIAFELGKNLPTPETIPFRLTRDIVAGMGISGTEGVFKKSCEKTLEILRNNHAPIMTILEVLLYDPLYTWNVLTNKKAARRQMAEMYGGEGIGFNEEKNEAVNISAERALLRISDKLNGKEDEKFTSVEGQVERLIFSATSNLNLCQLFQGWQPYL